MPHFSEVDVVMGKKRKATEEGEPELPKKRQTSRVAKESEKRLIIVLEGAHLETCKVQLFLILPGRWQLSAAEPSLCL